MSVPGLKDQIDIFTYNYVSDGAGGRKISEKQFIYKERHARISVMTSEKQLKWFGFAGKELWLVLLEYSPKLLNTGDFYIQLNQRCGPSIVECGAIYRSLKCRHQRDENGVFHHTSLAVERDESAEE